MATKRPTKAQLLARARFVARFGGGKKKRKRSTGKRKASKRRAAKRPRKHAAKKAHHKSTRKHEYLTHRGKLYRQVKGSVSVG